MSTKTPRPAPPPLPTGFVSPHPKDFDNPRAYLEERLAAIRRACDASGELSLKKAWSDTRVGACVGKGSSAFTKFTDTHKHATAKIDSESLLDYARALRCSMHERQLLRLKVGIWNEIKYAESNKEADTQAIHALIQGFHRYLDESHKLPGYFGDWHVPLVHHLTQLPGVQLEPQTIAQFARRKLPFSAQDVQHALEVLVELGLLDRVDGGYAINHETSKPLSTGREHDEIWKKRLGSASTAFHEQALENARSAFGISHLRRRLHAVIFRSNTAIYEDAVVHINALLDTLKTYNTHPADEATHIYQCNVQLFPLTIDTQKNRS